MRSWITTALRFLVADDSGQDLIEYALLVGLVSLIAVGALTAVGTTIRDVFWQVIADALGSVS